MELLTVIRIISVAILLIGVIYSIIMLKKHKFPTFFRCIFISITCSLFAYLYYLALSTDPSLDATFTVGIFGEAAQLLFIIAANTRFMEDDSFNKNFSLPGLIFAILLLIPEIIYVALSFSLENLICAIIYSSCVCPCGYFALSNLKDYKKYPFRNAIAFYNIITCIMIFLGAISQIGLGLAINLQSQLIFIILFCVPCIISSMLTTLSIFALRKGFKQWER